MIRLTQLAALFALLLTALSSTALAQGSDVLGAYGGARDPNRYRTGQEFMLELRVQQYIPDVDSEFADGARNPRKTVIPDDVAGPYEYTFGGGRRYAVGFELDWQVFRIPYVGTVGPAYGFLYTKSTAKARFLKDPSGPRSSEETSLTILPMYAVAVVRADVVWNEFGIPIIPYGKVGFGWALWWSKTGGETDEIDGKIGRGTTFGYQFALGASLLLDFFDEESAGEMDNSIGVNHSYIFGEWYVSKLEGGGIFSKQMYVGTNSWAAGLAFEF